MVNVWLLVHFMDMYALTGKAGYIFELFCTIGLDDFSIPNRFRHTPLDGSERETT